ncbi:hypothetical protein ES703_86356 [subsurface metagenome]
MYELIPVGTKFFAIVDEELAPGLRKFHWQPKVFRRCVYAITYIGEGEKRRRLNMHRWIARTQFPNVCHHKNSNTLDNRRTNLENMSKREHNNLHANDRILKQFEKTNTIK